MRLLSCLSGVLLVLVLVLVSFCGSGGPAPGNGAGEDQDHRPSISSEAEVAHGPASKGQGASDALDSRSEVGEAQLAGVVVGQKTGSPYTVPLWLVADNAAEGRRWLSVADGRFEVTAPEGAYHIESVIPVVRQRLVLVAGQRCCVNVIVLEVRPLAVVVRLDGVALAGADVWLSFPAKPFMGAIVGVTDAVGRLVLPSFASNTWVGARHPLASGVAAERLESPLKDDAEVDLNLHGGMRDLHLVVKGPDGSPLHGVRVTVRDRGSDVFPLVEESGARGQAEFAGVAERISILATTPGLAPFREALTVPLGASYQEVVLKRGARVKGLVASVRQLIAPRVTLRGLDYATTTVLGRDGGFEIDGVPAGTVVAALSDDGGAITQENLLVTEDATLEWNPVVTPAALALPVLRFGVKGGDEGARYTVSLDVMSESGAWVTSQVRQGARNAEFRLPAVRGRACVRVVDPDVSRAFAVVEKVFDWDSRDMRIDADIGDAGHGDVVAHLPNVVSRDGVSVIIQDSAGRGEAMEWSADKGGWVDAHVPWGSYNLVARGERIVPRAVPDPVTVMRGERTQVTLPGWRSCDVVRVALGAGARAWEGQGEQLRPMFTGRNGPWTRLEGNAPSWAVVLDANAVLHWYLVWPGMGDATLQKRSSGVTTDRRTTRGGPWTCEVVGPAGVSGRISFGEEDAPLEAVVPVGSTVTWTPGRR